MKKIVLKIEGMHCDGCAKRMENSLKKNEQIKNVSVSFPKKQAEILYEELTKEEIERMIEDIGFQSLGE